MSEYGPFNSEADARATRAAASLRAACDANPGAWQAEHLRVMTDACEAAGAELGDFDLAPFRQLAMYEPFNAVVLAAVIHRVFEAGKAAGPGGVVTEWGVRLTSVGGHNQVDPAPDEETARHDAAGRQEAVTPSLAGSPEWFIAAVSRKVTPWAAVPGEEEGNG